MINTRDSLCAIHYSGVKVENQYLTMVSDNFIGHPALISRGLWADNDPVMGGPFTNFSFYESSQKRLYMIDMFVYRPGKLKLPYLLPMEVLAHTFVTEDELKKTMINDQ